MRYRGPERRRYMRQVRSPLPFFAIAIGMLATELAIALRAIAR